MIKPLYTVTKRPSATSAHPPASIDNYEHHSRHRAEASRHYHQEVVGKMDTGQYGDRKISELNPTSTPLAVRQQNGLAN